MTILRALLLNSIFGMALLAAELPPSSPGSGTSAASSQPQVFPDNSLYQLDSEWMDDSGHPMKFGALSGRPQVVSMFFSSCVFACPILTHDMKKIEAALPPELQGKIGFTLISIDPERDTAAKLAAFRQNRKLPRSWTLLRGSSDDVLELAALLGVKYKKESNGQYSHSNLITVLNSKGEIVFQKAGLNTDPNETAAAIQKAFDRNGS
jgi:protein SCO1/2